MPQLFGHRQEACIRDTLTVLFTQIPHSSASQWQLRLKRIHHRQQRRPVLTTPPIRSVFLLTGGVGEFVEFATLLLGQHTIPLLEVGHVFPRGAHEEFGEVGLRFVVALAGA